MSNDEIFVCALNSIEGGELSLDQGDAPERYLWAARDLYELDPHENERVLVKRAKESDIHQTQRYIYAIMYYGAMRDDFLDETFDFLAALCERRDADPGIREAAACALYWSEFGNASDENLDRVYRCLERITSERPPVLTAAAQHNALGRLKCLEQRKAAYGDFLAGRIVVTDEVIDLLLSNDGPGSVAALGYTKANAGAIVRSIVWTSRWLWPSMRSAEGETSTITKSAQPSRRPRGSHT